MGGDTEAQSNRDPGHPAIVREALAYILDLPSWSSLLHQFRDPSKCKFKKDVFVCDRLS
jgi:hypothetical protein